jgi:hypothetical protein
MVPKVEMIKETILCKRQRRKINLINRKAKILILTQENKDITIDILQYLKIILRIRAIKNLSKMNSK